MKLLLALVIFIVLTLIGWMILGVLFGALGVPEIVGVIVIAAAVTVIAYRRRRSVANS